MKRKSTIKKFIALVLSVLVIASCWIFTPVEAEAASTNTYSVEMPRADSEYYLHSGIGSLPGKLANGKVYYATESNGKNYRGYEFHFLDAAHTKFAYCIEPGTDVVKDVSLVAKDEDAACAILAANANSYATDVNLTTDEFKTLLRKVLGYGYQHGVSFDLSGVGYDIVGWHNLKTNSTQKESFCYALATQLLVWEVIVGERNAQFEHVAVHSGYSTAYDHYIIHDHSKFADNPLKDRIDHYYNQIVRDVQAATPKNDESISGKTFELEANKNNKTMEVSIPDPNGLLKDIKSIPEIDGETVKHSGSALEISVPYRYAKEGVYTLKYSIKYKEPKNVTFYITDGTQDLISATGGFKETNDTFSFKIKIPHHHEWFPHLIIPTCTTEGLTCMMCKCGDIYTEKVTPALGHNHKGSAWVVGHSATCTEDGELVQICERCNVVIDSKPIPKTGHKGVWVIETEPTADHDGQMVLHCTKCGNRTETKPYSSHKHELGYEAVVSDATCVTEGLLGKFCKHCGVCYNASTIAAGHSKELTWVTTIQPTCTDEGERSAFCGDCGVIVTTKSIEATGHSEGIWITSVSPYCGLEGEEICVCDQCGETIDSRQTEALSHDEGVWKTVSDPTCEFEGERAKSCTRCGHIIETESIDALGHDDGVWSIDIEATADIDGSMNRCCTRCSMVLETATFALHTHEEGYKTTLLQPACTREGEKGTVCGICNAVFVSETVPALNHDYGEFYTESNGTHSKSCSRCHYEYTENCECEIIESYEVTCTTPGYKTNKCTVCDYTYSDSFVLPYGHTFGKWTSEGKSTHMRYCADCGVMEISKHIWGEYFSNGDGDIIEEGSKTSSCIYCGETKTVGKPASIIKSTLQATLMILEFLEDLVDALGRLFDFIEKFVDFVKTN